MPQASDINHIRLHHCSRVVPGESDWDRMRSNDWVLDTMDLQILLLDFGRCTLNVLFELVVRDAWVEDYFLRSDICRTQRK